jgi:hypothetical protein
MTWGVEAHVIERFAGAGMGKDRIAFTKDTFTFDFKGTPAQFVGEFKTYYGPTMNAFEAAAKAGRAADLEKELVALFEKENRSGRKDATVIPATFLRVTVSR